MADPDKPLPLILSIVCDGWDFGVKLSWFTGVNEVAKAFGGRFVGQKDHPCYRYWRFTKAIMDEKASALLDAMCEKAGPRFQADGAEFLQALDEARGRPAPACFTHDLNITIYPLDLVESALVANNYHPGVVATVKTMGGRYIPMMRAWRLPATSPAALQNNLLQELRLQESQVIVLAGEYAILEDGFSSSQHSDVCITVGGPAFIEGDGSGVKDDGKDEIYLAVTAPLASSHLNPEMIETGLERFGPEELLDHQRSGVRHLVGKTSALLADDMGLGKSRQAVVAADLLAATGEQILITCPASLVLNWSREINLVCPLANVATQRYDADARWIVTNYERLKAMLPYSDRFRVMVIDEAHSLKEATSQRTRLVFDVAAAVPYRFILTATPILNRESEMHTLLRLSGHPLGDCPLRDFESQFAGDPGFRAALNQRIGEWMLRRKKDMVLKSLAGKQRQLLPVVMGMEARQAYEAVIRDPDKDGLEKIMRLRQVLENIKLDSIVAMISQLASDDKVLIFTEFRQTVFDLKERLEALGLPTVTLMGDDSSNKRQKTVDQFQTDPDTRVFVGTTKAAGVGINLTAANYVMFASLPWTPALLEQAEDRAYRMGQKRLVIVKVPLVEDSIDSLLWALLQDKHSIANEVLSPKDMAGQLAGKLMLAA